MSKSKDTDRVFFEEPITPLAYPVPFLRTPLNYDRHAASVDSGLRCLDASLAKQSFAEEVDINTIVRRFNLTGQMPTDIRMPEYGDYEGVWDYHSALNSVRRGEESFARLPAEVRARFHNDPGEFVAFCLDEGNRPEAIKLGLIEAQAAQLAGTAPQDVPGAPQAPSAVPAASPPGGKSGG